MPQARTAQEVIDHAVRENRPGLVLCYALIGICAAAGVFVLIWGAMTREGLVALASAVPGLLLVPLVKNAREILRHNQMVRLLEVPLSKAVTSEEATRALRDLLPPPFGSGGEP